MVDIKLIPIAKTSSILLDYRVLHCGTSFKEIKKSEEL
jgi:hypothetical protein